MVSPSLPDPSAQQLIANLVSNAISAGLGIAVGGESGGALASTMDRHNRQNHDAEIALLKRLATDENGWNPGTVCILILINKARQARGKLGDIMPIKVL